MHTYANIIGFSVDAYQPKMTVQDVTHELYAIGASVPCCFAVVVGAKAFAPTYTTIVLVGALLTFLAFAVARVVVMCFRKTLEHEEIQRLRQLEQDRCAIVNDVRKAEIDALRALASRGAS